MIPHAYAWLSKINLLHLSSPVENRLPQASDLRLDAWGKRWQPIEWSGQLLSLTQTKWNYLQIIINIAVFIKYETSKLPAYLTMYFCKMIYIEQRHNPFNQNRSWVTITVFYYLTSANKMAPFGSALFLDGVWSFALWVFWFTTNLWSRKLAVISLLWAVNIFVNFLALKPFVSYVLAILLQPALFSNSSLIIKAQFSIEKNCIWVTANPLKKKNSLS